MNAKLSEIERIQNPALGAYAIWQFGLSFQAEDGRPAPLHLVFVVLPLLFHAKTLDVIASTRKPSGLTLFAAKLGEERENLLAVHERVLALRELTLESIVIGIRSKLLSLDYNDALLRANSIAEFRSSPALPERLKLIPRCADKVGSWFLRAGLSQVATTLKVEF